MGAREAFLWEERKRADQEQEAMVNMLKTMAIHQTRAAEDIAAQFVEREKRLWADIDAAIQEAERKEKERAAAEEAERKKAEEEEAARVARAEQEAKARREEAERLAKENAEKEVKRQEDEAKARAEEERQAREADQRAAEEERRSKAKGQTADEWREWVDKQRWMKSEVIEPVKADRATRTTLRTGMRLITRGLGQVVNTKESVLRVVSVSGGSESP